MFVLTLTMRSLIYEATNYGKWIDNYLFALLDVRVKLDESLLRWLFYRLQERSYWTRTQCSKAMAGELGISCWAVQDSEWFFESSIAIWNQFDHAFERALTRSRSMYNASYKLMYLTYLCLSHTIGIEFLKQFRL